MRPRGDSKRKGLELSLAQFEQFWLRERVLWLELMTLRHARRRVLFQELALNRYGWIEMIWDTHRVTYPLVTWPLVTWPLNGWFGHLLGWVKPRREAKPLSIFIGVHIIVPAKPQRASLSWDRVGLIQVISSIHWGALTCPIPLHHPARLNPP